MTGLTTGRDPGVQTRRADLIVTPALIAGLIAAIVAVTVWLAPGRISPLVGADPLRQGVLCSAGACRSVALPYRSAPQLTPGEQTASLTLTGTAPRAPVEGVPISGGGGEAAADEPLALYLPAAGQARRVTVNGVIAWDAAGRYATDWNAPVLISLAGLVAPGQPFDVTVSLVAPADLGLWFWPAQIGPANELQRAAQARYWAAVGNARLVQMLLVVLAAGHFFVVLASPSRERGHFWMAISAVLGVLFLSNFSGTAPPIPERFWTPLWMLAVCAYVVAIMNFIMVRLSLDHPRLRRAALWVLAAGALATALVPSGYGLAAGLTFTAATVAISMINLTILWRHRAALKRTNFLVYFSCFILAVALGVHETLATAVPLPLVPLHIFYLAPLFVAGASLWLILSQLIEARDRAQHLNRDLAAQVRSKTDEIRAGFQELAAARERAAIERERARFLLDLHDGIGGQLTNVLAYLENTGAGDDTIRLALEDALRDLGLMLDSIETEDSIATLLGMLRTRLEGLLASHHLRFDWDVNGEPRLPMPGPSENLGLLRIVQEAITNTIRHAQARTVYVYADSERVRIADDGQGFAIDASSTRARPRGHGVEGMRRRARDLGIGFELNSSRKGTRIDLLLRPDAARPGEEPETHCSGTGGPV